MPRWWIYYLRVIGLQRSNGSFGWYPSCPDDGIIRASNNNKVECHSTINNNSSVLSCLIWLQSSMLPGLVLGLGTQIPINLAPSLRLEWPILIQLDSVSANWPLPRCVRDHKVYVDDSCCWYCCPILTPFDPFEVLDVSSSALLSTAGVAVIMPSAASVSVLVSVLILWS